MLTISSFNGVLANNGLPHSLQNSRFRGLPESVVLSVKDFRRFGEEVMVRACRLVRVEVVA